MTDIAVLRNLTAAYELISRASLTHTRPPYRIDQHYGRQSRGPGDTRRRRYVTPFGTLLHFKKDVDTPQPRVLLVAPLSGHFATLLRDTVRTLLPEHDVYITDWHNARDVAVSARPVRLRRLHRSSDPVPGEIGPGAHVVAVCQPCVAVLAAVAVMAENGNPAQPRSMTLMAGPIDCRVNPTEVNELATEPDRVVREEPDRDRAGALRRRGAAGLSGLRAARGFHEHESRAPHAGASRSLRQHRQGRAREGGGHKGLLR